MTTQPIENYLEGGYLQDSGGYLSGVFGAFTCMQAWMKIDSPDDDDFTGIQTELFVDRPEDDDFMGMQVDLKTNSEKATGIQSKMFVASPDDDDFMGVQAEFVVSPTPTVGMQVKIFPLQHWLHPKYLNDTEGYLEESYLAEKMCAFQGMQFRAAIDSAADDDFMGVQTQLKIIDILKTEGMQTKFVIEDQLNLGMQANLVSTIDLGMQANLVIYNKTQLRILDIFKSRGVSNEYDGVANGDNANWTAVQAMASGNLGNLGNLNTDVLEQRIQTADGVTALFELRCDTGASNTFVDTIAILEHNLTKSATVTVQGSLVGDFSSIEFSYVMETELDEMYYISPSLPTQSARFYRFLIQDSTNTDNNIKIGTIIFGSSKILTPSECFQNPVSYGLKHFKDTINTEGFTNNSNDRATRKFLSLNFVQLNFSTGNYKTLKNFYREAKTDLKCLIIPRPTQPSSLAVFAKLNSLPSESHYAIDDDNHHVDLTLDWDESL